MFPSAVRWYVKCMSSLSSFLEEGDVINPITQREDSETGRGKAKEPLWGQIEVIHILGES